MNKTWKPIAAGILDIIIGAFLALFGLQFFLAGIFAETRMPMHGLMIILIFTAIASLAWLAIIGGKYNLKRTKWHLAMTGSITATIILGIFAFYFKLIFFQVGIIPAWVLIILLGIAVIILTFRSRKEFEQREELRHVWEKTWKPKAAGILDIICGVYSIIIVYYALILNPRFEYAIVEIYGRLILYYSWLAGLILIFIAGTLAIPGGIYALRSKRWRLALAGAIAASIALILLAIPLSLSSIYPISTLHALYDMAHPAGAVILVLLGIAVIVLTVISKKEFK